MKFVFVVFIVLSVQSFAAELKSWPSLKSNGIQGGNVPCSPDAGTKGYETGCVCVGDNCNQTPLDAALGRNTKQPENQSLIQQNGTEE
jgi:hypothetical protein